MDLITLLTLGLLAAGIIGSFVPLVPGSLLSIIGITLYWWSTGFSKVGIIAVAMIYLTALTALFFDLFAGAIGSKVGGASDKTVKMAAIAGIIFFFIGGPIGTLVGVTLVVFLREHLLTGKTRTSLRSAVYTTGSILGSALVQAFFTSMALLIFLIAWTI